MHVNTTCLSIILILAGVFNTVSAQSDESEWLERGLLAESRGNPEEALQIWAEAIRELEKPFSRLGFEYIRLAAEHGLQTYYSNASVFYDYALSEPFRDVNRASVRQEIKRLQPLTGSGIYRQWSEWFEEQNDALITDMRGFWKQLDPTPGSSVNERLIEHWQRIAHSRKTYTRNHRTIFDGDERGLVHVRYGEPDRIKRGVLTIDNQTLGQWISRQFNSAEPPRDPEGGQPSPQPFADRGEQRDPFAQLEEYVFQFHTQPEYEIWIYEPLTDASDYPLIFIFGIDPQSGEFIRLQSPDDFIPERAYLSDQRNQSQVPGFVRLGLTPALALQMLYYEQLADIDPWFREQLNAIRSLYVDQGPSVQRSLDLSIRNRNRELLEIRMADSPTEISTETRHLPEIPIDLYQYRLLDESLEPVLISFLETRPTPALISDLTWSPEHSGEDFQETGDTTLVHHRELVDQYELAHQLLVYTTDWDEELILVDTPSLEHLPESGQDAIIQSVFLSSHSGQRFQSASATLVHENGEQLNRYSPLYPPMLRGLGGLKSQQPSPLINIPGQLELADLILGFRDDHLPESYPFSFRVANDQTIPADESLVLHFEVYNLTPNPDTDFTRFELTYHIYPVLEDGTVVSGEEEFYLTIRFEDDRTRVVEDLEIRTSDLRRGLYELQVYIRDLEGEQEQRRDIRFEVTDRNQGNIPIDS